MQRPRFLLVLAAALRVHFVAFPPPFSYRLPPSPALYLIFCRLLPARCSVLPPYLPLLSVSRPPLNSF